MLEAAGVSATEETPLTADLSGTLRKITMAGALATAWMLAIEGTKASNRRNTKNITEQKQYQKGWQHAGMLAKERPKQQ
jgi:hypothetical protein